MLQIHSYRLLSEFYNVVMCSWTSYSAKSDFPQVPDVVWDVYGTSRPWLPDLQIFGYPPWERCPRLLVIMMDLIIPLSCKKPPDKSLPKCHIISSLCRHYDLWGTYLIQIPIWTTLIHTRKSLQFVSGFFVQDVAQPGPPLPDVWILAAEYYDYNHYL